MEKLKKKKFQNKSRQHDLKTPIGVVVRLLVDKLELALGKRVGAEREAECGARDGHGAAHEIVGTRGGLFFEERARETRVQVPERVRLGSQTLVSTETHGTRNPVVTRVVFVDVVNHRFKAMIYQVHVLKVLVILRMNYLIIVVDFCFLKIIFIFFKFVSN